MANRIFARIAGTGSYLPEKVLTNGDLAKMVDTSDEWIHSRTGIRMRHIVAPDQTSCDLAYAATLPALDAAGINPAEIGLIVVGTTTPDYAFPSIACTLQARLGISGCGAMDVNAACSGFIYALSIADKFIRCGDCKVALVVGAETLTRTIDWSDRTTCVLFGDGAGAVVLRADSQTGVLNTYLHADGSKKDLLWSPSVLHSTHATAASEAKGLQMRGNEVFKYAVKALDSVVDETLHANGLDKRALDWLIPHQANLRIIEATAKRLDMPMDRVVVTIDRHGNTSAASVPLALDEAVRSGRIVRNDLLMFEAFGGGFTWGSALVRY